MSGGMLAQLIQMLADVPSVILLILKTNDLTRSLEENLQTGRGPERSFLLMAHYCTRAVYDEARREIARSGAALLSWTNLRRYLAALWEYWRVESKLKAFDLALYWSGVLGRRQQLA